MRLLHFSMLWLLGSAGSVADAFELGAPGDLLSVDVHAFISQGYIGTTANNYLAPSEWNRKQYGSFEFTEAGLTVSKQLTDHLRTGIQLFGQKLGPLGGLGVQLDWFLLDYRLKDWLGIRAGRVKAPFGLYNDINDIDAARLPVLLPQSIYQASSRDYFLAVDGTELYGLIKMARAGAIDYGIYGGTSLLNTTSGSATQIVSLTTPYVAGGRLMWETPLEGLRFGASVRTLRIDTTLLLPVINKPVFLRIPATLFIASIEYANNGLLLALEYGRWYVDIETSDAKLFPASSTVADRAYLMANYRLTPWFQFGAYYSLIYPNEQLTSGKENQQHDLAATLRFDINNFWLVKIEGHFMHGTAGLTPALNDGHPLTALEGDWGVVLAKTTAHF